MKLAWWIIGALRQLFKPRQDLYHCPWCDYEHDCEHLIVKWHTGGQFSTGEITSHWREGTAECPRCGHKFPYADSD